LGATDMCDARRGGPGEARAERKGAPASFLSVS
jgi:hypothetical protein